MHLFVCPCLSIKYFLIPVKTDFNSATVFITLQWLVSWWRYKCYWTPLHRMGQIQLLVIRGVIRSYFPNSHPHITSKLPHFLLSILSWSLFESFHQSFLHFFLLAIKDDFRNFKIDLFFTSDIAILTRSWVVTWDFYYTIAIARKMQKIMKRICIL